MKHLSCLHLVLYSSTCTSNRSTQYTESNRTTRVEPHSTDTHLILAPIWNRQFCLSQWKAHKFSLKLTRFMHTPVNTHNGHFSMSQVTYSHILSFTLRTREVTANFTDSSVSVKFFLSARLIYTNTWIIRTQYGMCPWCLYKLGSTLHTEYKNKTMKK